MKLFHIFFCTLLFASSCTIQSDKTTHLERNLQSGLSTEKFDRMFNDIAHVGATCELHDLLVIKDGKVVYERYDPAHCPTQKHALWSASKTFTATAIGFAVQEGLLNVQDHVTEFFAPEELPDSICQELGDLRVWNLLTMTSGVTHDPIGDVESLDVAHPSLDFLHDTYDFAPGTRFRYNSMNTYMLSAIITKLTGETVVSYLTPRLFHPLGIYDFYWKESPEGYSMGGWGLFLRAEDLAKMGLWMLQRGEWEGKQLLSKEWFDEAMSVQVMQSIGLGLNEEEIASKANTDDWQAGYGYQMWHCTTDAYRIDGAWGQFSIICPSKNAVITLNTLSNRADEVLKYIWKNVYEEL